ncbi:Polyadenylate-binding protein [Musa troglodytarum]|uniref:Polyadenylate-binding protein n=1 Tax=Musa troglodytarum TaxID=320322 RepID=A0A9E7FJF0_9LILI|nr:Polyadenylate-binding protein [Musa troglodytarum]
MAQVPLQQQAAVPGPAEGGGGAQFSSTSLYVGDLDSGVTDAQLYDVFSQIGAVVSVRVCRDMNTRFSLGYAYVNYNDAADAARALEVLNFMPLNGKTIRIMHSNRDPSTRRSGAANIFIKNLDKCIDNKALYDTFSAFGNILSCKVATDASGQSKGYGFVQFEQDDAAQNAIENLNGMLLNDKKVFVGPFIRKQERENAASNTKFSNVFVKNLSESTTEDTLQEVFGEFGKITSCIVMRGEDGKSKCFGFVNFENPDEAAEAVEELNGKKFDDKEWYVGRAQKKSEREQELKEKFEQSKQESSEKLEGVNLYLKNLDDNIGDDNLRELFSGFGAIASCKVVRDKNGVSKGSGFVVFQSPEDASRALLEMNGKMIGNKPLYVALAQRKEDRRARLQAQFSQMRPVVMPPSVAPRVPLYPPGAPGLGQQLFYGQPPALVPPQPGFGFPQPLVTGMRPGAAPFPNFFMPMAQQGQQAQRPGGRRAGAGPLQQTQQHPMQMIQQQMLPRGGRPYRYPPGRGMPEVGNPEGMFSTPYDMGGMPARHAGMSRPVPVGELTSALANATPEQQRMMLGENLYPLVDQLEHGYAAKVTGMLLEMDQNEVLHLLESPEALQTKVAEAMGVLRSVVQQQHVANRLAGLSLNDVS